jgi:[acyl-carrier-protein] S-malonyltransferase
MAEYHPGTTVVIPDAVPTSGFRNAIKNEKRYMKHNSQTIEKVCEAAYVGDYDLLEELLATGDEKTLFNGDLNLHCPTRTALMLAAQAGQSECIELLLQAKADPHMKERMAYGHDPEDGKTACEIADELGFGDIVDILQLAEKETPYGWYVPEGPTNNEKMYNGWEWGKNTPGKGWHSSRPGVAQRNGFDASKYGDPTPKPPKIFDDFEPTSKPAAAGSSGTTLPIGLLFPGTGSQYLKMIQTVKDLPAVKDMCAKANAILGYDILDVSLNGPESKLAEPTYCQPAMLIAGLAAVEKLRGDKPEALSRCQAVAGMYEGEYTALVVAGVLSFEESLKLCKVRGEAMSKAAAVGKQAMLSVAGIDKEKLNGLCKEAAKKESGGVCVIANELFPKGFSCSGTETAINALKELADKNGALQAKVMKMGGFHTSLMLSASTEIGAALDDAVSKMSPTKITVYMNATGQGLKPGTSPEEVVSTLKQQMCSPVLWETSMKSMIKDGVKDFYECGPMKQIKAMMKRIDPTAWSNTQNCDI